MTIGLNNEWYNMWYERVDKKGCLFSYDMWCERKTEKGKKSIFLKELIPHQMYIMYTFDYHWQNTVLLFKKVKKF